MEADNFLLFKYINSGRMGRINSILVKLPMENLLGYFTQNGGISAPSALFIRCAGGVVFMVRDCRDVLQQLDKAGKEQQHGC